MSFRWNDAIGFLRAGDFQQAAESLDRARQECEAQGDTLLAATLRATQKLCLMCLECSTATYYHQQALVAMSDQLERLSTELFDIIAALQRMEPDQPLEPLLEPAPRYTANTLHPSFWQRLYSMVAREKVIAYPVALDPLPPLPLLAGSDDQPSAGLAVCCFGPFRVYQRDQPVREWLSRKGKSIFKYLVAHRDRPIPKEVLMELVWPDTHPDAARNNLNVAIYGLRQSLRQGALSESLIVYQDDCYLLNPDVTVWVDAEAFSAHVARAHEYEESGQPLAAMREYRLAEALYSGDYLEEDRYEDWPRTRRQSLRDTYLDVLERLCRHYYEQGDTTACVAEANKVLAVDVCHEPAHRWIMRCYAQQGQRYLAIRQYQTCVDALAEELGVEPSAETAALYNEIISGEGQWVGAPLPFAVSV
ncbi:MAG: hypothetical protein GX613_08820 [Chloroflexi bacterium]|nr:hypothetical protein [Chloroflexota bacterium]